jgi:hypothetical protein
MAGLPSARVSQQVAPLRPGISSLQLDAVRKCASQVKLHGVVVHRLQRKYLHLRGSGPEEFVKRLAGGAAADLAVIDVVSSVLVNGVGADVCD